MNNSIGDASRSSTRRFFWILLTVALLAVGAIYAFGPSRATRSQLIASLRNAPTSLAGNSWSPRRGRTPVVLGPQDSFRLGVRSIELRLAAERGDQGAVSAVCREIILGIDPATAPDVEALVRSIAKSSSEGRIAQIDMLESLLDESSFFLEVADLRFGQWARAAQEVLAAARPELFDLMDKTFPDFPAQPLEERKAIRALVVRGELDEARTKTSLLISNSGLSALRKTG